MAKKDFLPAPDATTQATLDRRKQNNTSNSGANTGGVRDLTASEQSQIAELQKAWAGANAAGDKQGMENAHKKAEEIRAGAGFFGGADGSAIIPTGTNAGGLSPSHGTALLDGATPKQEQNPVQDSQALLSDIDRQIKELQDQWAAASAEGNQEKMDAAHMEAERLRASQGYLGGADGSGYIPIVMGKGNKGEDGTDRQQLSAIDGGYSFDDVLQMLNAFKAASSDGANWHNGYNSAMNNRSMTNFIRQQMLANSNAWQNADAAQREYLHDQNVQLAGLLPKFTGGGGKSTFNESLGRWETEDGNLGYGYVTNLRDAPSWNPDGAMTAEQREQFATDTDRYRNYVDYDLPLHWMDNSSGFTGKYENYIDGPYGQWLTADALGRPNRATDTNLIGDGFMDEYDYTFIDGKEPPRDENGDYILYQPMRKDNNSLTDYTRSKAAYVDASGIIRPGSLDGTKYAGAENNMWLNGGTPVEDPGENFGVTWGTKPTAHTRLGGSFTPMEELGFGGGNGGAKSYEEKINAQYDADLQAKLAALEQEYNLALAELEQTKRQTGDQYYENRRQAAGSAEREAAARRELANAQGVSSGAIGQTDLVNRGQLQNEMAAMGGAEAQALAAIEQQRAILAQTYQLKIQQAEAENDYARAQALLQEAQRADEALRQEQQAQAQNMLSLMSMFGG